MMRVIWTVVLDLHSLPTQLVRVAFTRPQDWFVVVGLITDLIAALYLIIPDVHLFRRSVPNITASWPWPRSGRLVDAQDRLHTGVLHPSDSGFNEVIDTLSSIEPEHNYPDIQPTEAVRIVAKQRGESPEGASEERLDWQQEHIEVHCDEAGNWHHTIFYDYTTVQRSFESTINQWARHWRVTGIATLITGFMLQLIGTVLA
jgi:hypothetical protein